MGFSKRSLSITLVFILLIGSISVGGNGIVEWLDFLTVNASAASSYSDGDIIEFGSYPQSRVTGALSYALDGVDGKWVSYNYWCGDGTLGFNGQSSPSDFMLYKDVVYEGNRYRGVTFSTYRPTYICDPSSNNLDGTGQDNNGYTCGNVYWFKFEPIKWRIIDSSIGLVLCESILDSQPYTNWILEENKNGTTYYWGNPEKTYYSNSYPQSSIRQWLNDDFYNTAFTLSQKSSIAPTTISKDGYISSATYSPAITDNVYLLSYDEVKSLNYSVRIKQGSDYALCQGALNNWRLRTKKYASQCYSYSINSEGYYHETCGVTDTRIGICPAMQLDLNSFSNGNSNWSFHELINRIIKTNPYTISFPVKALNKNGYYSNVAGAKVDLYLGSRKILSKHTDNNGIVTIMKKELSGLTQFQLNNITVYSEKYVGNHMYLLSDYNYGCYHLNELNDGGSIILNNKQLRVSLSLAYTLKLGLYVDVESVCLDFMSKLYDITGGRILIENIEWTEYLQGWAVDNSGCNILAYYNGEKSCANPNGFWGNGHIYISQTYNGGFSAEVLCHEALHYLIGVEDEYCCGYRIINNSYDLDINCDGIINKIKNNSDGTVDKNSYYVFWVADGYQVNGATRINDRRYINKHIEQNYDEINSMIEENHFNISKNDIMNSGSLYAVKDPVAFANSLPLGSCMLVSNECIENYGTYFFDGGFGFFNKPISSYGIMESDYENPFISNEETYNYLNGYDYNERADHAEIYSAQYYVQGKSVDKAIDDKLCSLITSTNTWSSQTTDWSTSYSKKDFNFNESSIINNENEAVLDNYIESQIPICNIEFEKNFDEIKITASEGLGFASNVIINYSNGETRSYEFCNNEGVAEIVISESIFDIASFIVCDDTNYIYNEYYVEKFSEELSDGTKISSLMSVSSSINSCDYIISNNLKFNYNNFTPVATTFYVVEENLDPSSATFTQVVPFDIDANLSTIKVYKYKNGIYQEIEHWTSAGEHNVLYISFLNNGPGKYIVMADAAAQTGLQPVGIDVYSEKNANCDNQISFIINDNNDINDISAYVVYYSNHHIDSQNINEYSHVIVKPNKDTYSMALTQDYGTIYFAVIAIGSDGSQSPFSDEFVYNVLPKDTNSDGLPDYWVSQYLMNNETLSGPLDDPDNDGLNNFEEYQYDTNPLNPDTDGDNVYDFAELEIGLDPLNPKTDGETDDYVALYGNPDVSIDKSSISYDNVTNTISVTIANSTDAMAMHESVNLYVGSYLVESCLVNLDANSEVEYEFSSEYFTEGMRIVLDENQKTFDADYSNNELQFCATQSIAFSASTISVPKNQPTKLNLIVTPLNACCAVKWSIVTNDSISIDKYGTITSDGLGSATVTATTLEGLTASCVVEIVNFEGAEFSYYETEFVDNGLKIVKYYGNETNATLPNTLGGYNVTEIDTNAFNNSVTQSITIPDNIATISSSAFSKLTALKQINVSSGNEYFTSENGILYSKDLSQLVRCPMAYQENNIIIPSSVREICSYAFSDTSIINVELSEALKIIRSYAFQGTQLSSVTIPTSVQRIEGYAFSNCSFLEEVYYNATSAETGISTALIVFLKSSPFKNCNNIRTVYIGKNVADIPIGLFCYLTGIETVYINEDAELTTVNKYAFQGCSSLSDVYYGRYYKYWKQISIKANNTPLTSAALHCVECNECTWVVQNATTSATCIHKGFGNYVCEVCEKEKTDEISIDPNNHNSELIYQVIQKATCGKDGICEYVCPDCGEIVSTGKLTNRPSHNYGSWSEWAEDYNGDTVRHRDCNNCGHQQAQTIPRLPKGRTVNIIELIRIIFTRIFAKIGIYIMTSK